MDITYLRCECRHLERRLVSLSLLLTRLKVLVEGDDTLSLVCGRRVGGCGRMEQMMSLGDDDGLK